MPGARASVQRLSCYDHRTAMLTQCHCVSGIGDEWAQLEFRSDGVRETMPRIVLKLITCIRRAAKNDFSFFGKKKVR